MSFSGAGGNRQRQLIAYAGPWSLILDDFGPYKAPSGWTKHNIQTELTGTGWGITIYDSVSQSIDDFVIGQYNPQYGIYANPKPPPPMPTAEYGAALVAFGVGPTAWNKSIGPSAQAGTGIEANPLISDGLFGQTFIMNYSTIWIKAVITTVGTGTLKVWQFSAP